MISAMAFVDRAAVAWPELWRRFSIRAMLIGTALQTALLAFPPELEQFLPRWLLQTITITILVCETMAQIGRRWPELKKAIPYDDPDHH